jgi:two-component system, OmpR family, sensor histidine kinase MtrB
MSTVAPLATGSEPGSFATGGSDVSGVEAATPTLPLAAPTQRQRLGLRRRIMLIFTLGALIMSLFLAFVTYGFTRASLVQQRENSALAESQKNAVTAGNALGTSSNNAAAALDALEAQGVERPLIWFADDWLGGQVGYDETRLPQSLVDAVIDDGDAQFMRVRVGDELNVVVGQPLAADGAYFEFFSLDEVNSTLRSVQLSLVLATLITTALAVLGGQLAARRAVRPVGVAAQAAKAIAGGRLDTRLEPTDDPDLRVLATSFNDMAAALQTRIERDARFASDVSHELRSPLMTLSASVEVMDARRDEMPERAQAALDLLKSDVVRFQGLVEDLLEISRFDAGAVRLHMEELLAAEFVRNAVAVSSLPETPIAVAPRCEAVLINGDRRRLARVVANLIDNARLHGGGSPEVSITEVAPDDGPITRIRIAVEDHGSGVPEHERSLIFERFARGGVAGRRAGNDGAGLGLSLVDEHVRMHGGQVWAEDRIDGDPGARFVIELPAEELDE